MKETEGTVLKFKITQNWKGQFFFFFLKQEFSVEKRQAEVLI